ncbi:MAG: chemotaxis protein CheW [Bacteroidales bacterium]
MVIEQESVSQQEILKSRAIVNSVNENHNEMVAQAPTTVIKFSLISKTYAFETKYISEVLLIKNITPIPGTPPFVAGVINIRGRIVSAINLKSLLNMGERGLTDQNRLIVLSMQTVYFGVICDAVLGVFTEDRALVKSPPSNLPKNYLNYITGVLPDGTILLNAQKILTSSEIIINK